MPAMIQSPLSHLSDEQIDELARELDAIHDEVFADLGERDRAYITNLIGLHRRLVVLGRVLLLGSRYRPLWLAGTVTLSMAKILENMEIGHNVMHGQWDWMKDPQINSSTWDWDSASTPEAWKHSHNYLHHTYTNILDKDRDLGYAIMRVDPHQRWNPIYLGQPLYNVMLAALFEWGVAFHDLDPMAVKNGDKSTAQARRELKGMVGKARRQIVKDYVAWPAVSGVAGVVVDAVLADRRPALVNADPALSRPRNVVRALVGRRSFRRPFRATATADATANILRNVWAYGIIFCGHFPDQTYTFTQEEAADESRGGYYARQLLGSANIEGGPFFHVASGNLGYQVEHHLYPDMPSTRYAEIAPRVKEICRRYELPYNTGPFLKQLATVQRTILRLALPGGKPRPKPGPYRGNDAAPRAANGASPDRPPGVHGSGPEQPTDGVRVRMPHDG